MVREWFYALDARRPTYECLHCELSFEDERLNCPACGFPVEDVS